MLRGFRIYPLLFAAVPILQLQANNAGISTIADLLVVLAVAVAAFAAIQVVALVALHAVGRAELAPLVTLLAAIWFFGYRPMAERLHAHGLESGPPLLLAAGLLASAGVLAWRRVTSGADPLRISLQTFPGRARLLTGAMSKVGA